MVQHAGTSVIQEYAALERQVRIPLPVDIYAI